ncbi:unnamed protein product [Adineta steineri]|uniref:F-box domain-containing protein n=1 Tax=Adineta steineri TaxID=433720 RepID=A0A818P6L1_9BILA|nr:unnamed protein product [Adineta steineri]
MSTRLEDLPNELFVHLFSNYFHGVELYKLFSGLNIRFNNLLKLLNNIYIRLENSNDDQCLNFFSQKIHSLYIDSQHKSIHFLPLLINIRSITLVDPTIIQIINLLEISSNVERICIQWSNPYLINLISARSFYELIFSASSLENLRSCRLYLPENHSFYFEPKHCTLPLLHTIYVQITIPLADFRRIIRLCPNLIRLEIEIIDNGHSNNETIILLNHCEHRNIRQFHVYNLLSLDILEIYIDYFSKLTKLYISMKLTSYPLDVFKQISNLIHRIYHLKQFHFRFSTHCWNIGYQQLQILKQLNPFFENIHIENKNNEVVFIN